MKHKTGDLARALVNQDKTLAGIVDSDIVRGWCERNAIDAWKNPGGKWYLRPAGPKTLKFMEKELNLCHKQIEGVLKEMKVPLVRVLRRAA